MTRHDRSLAAPEVRALALGLLTPHNVHDPRAFSGTVYHAARALARVPGVDLTLLGGHRPPGIGTRFGDRLVRRFGQKRAVAPPQAADLAGLDAVVGLVASDLLDQLPPVVPYLHVTDATPGFLADAYGWDIDAETHAREVRVAQDAAVCLYSSGMMAARARTELGIARADVLPFGVNLDLDRVQSVDKPPLRPLELLYVGADWARKGGEIALGALAHLRDMGVPTRLTLVGRIPEHAARIPGVTVAGFLDKTRPRDVARLRDLYARAHLLVLPTRGDCTPMVIAEAMAHGTPVLATETGGIPEMIGADAGRCLPVAATAADWAETISDMTRDPDAYDWMSDAARDRAETRFSWDVWARGVAGIAARSLTGAARAA